MGKKREPSEREQFWLSHLRACAGGELKAYAEAHGLAVESLYQARHRLRSRGLLASRSAAKPRFARVERTEAHRALRLRPLALRGGPQSPPRRHGAAGRVPKVTSYKT
jgi:hypothetical protein